MPNMNTNLLVRNVSNSSWRSCTCGSWIEHWYAATGSSRAYCAVLGCTNLAEVGAHVRILDRRSGDGLYIAPLCRACNIHHNTDEMWLDSRVDLISANTQAMGCYRG